MLEKVTPSALHLQDHQGVVLKISLQFGFNKSEHREWVSTGTAWAIRRKKWVFRPCRTFVGLVVVFSAVTVD